MCKSVAERPCQMQISPSIHYKWNQETHEMNCSRKKSSQYLHWPSFFCLFPCQSIPEEEEEMSQPCQWLRQHWRKGWRGKAQPLPPPARWEPQESSSGNGGSSLRGRILCREPLGCSWWCAGHTDCPAGTACPALSRKHRAAPGSGRIFAAVFINCCAWVFLFLFLLLEFFVFFVFIF